MKKRLMPERYEEIEIRQKKKPGKQLIVGVNDLATVCPKVAAQWHPTKNGDLLPSMVMAGSGKMFWWLCDKGHEWKTSVGHRSLGSGCPYCAGVRVTQSENDFATVCPDLVSQWHPTKNGELLPSMVMAGSAKKVWWLCDKGHEWKTSVGRRSLGSGCPYCAGVRVTQGENDFATVCPDLVSQWHPTKNGELLPSMVMAGSVKKVWWLCDKGHEWQAVVCDRSRGTRCPYCAGSRVVQGETDLATLRPDIAAQWHHSRNSDLSPEQFTVGAAKKVWWLCDKGHEWQTTIAARTRGAGCPRCAGKIATPGETDLASLCPELAAQWHPTKNGDLSPARVTAHSGKRVWWLCDKGHEWQATVCDRSKGHGCPYCAGSRAIPGESDLTTLRPDLAAQWHPTKNGTLSINQVQMRTRVWWQCRRGHEWQSTLAMRKQGKGCPYCAGKIVIPGDTDLATLRPDLAAQWHPKANAPLTPAMVSIHSNKKVWWLCSNGHEWKAQITSRAYGTGCPGCNTMKPVSFPEKAIAYYLAKIYSNIQQNDRSTLQTGTELDIYIPLLKTAVEYDGAYWHQDKYDADTRKAQQCAKQGIQLIRIREKGLEPISGCICIPRNANTDKSLNKTIKEVIKALGQDPKTVDIDVARDRSQIQLLLDEANAA